MQLRKKRSGLPVGLASRKPGMPVLVFSELVFQTLVLVSVGSVALAQAPTAATHIIATPIAGQQPIDPLKHSIAEVTAQIRELQDLGRALKEKADAEAIQIDSIESDIEELSKKLEAQDLSDTAVDRLFDESTVLQEAIMQSMNEASGQRGSFPTRYERIVESLFLARANLEGFQTVSIAESTGKSEGDKIRQEEALDKLATEIQRFRLEHEQTWANLSFQWRALLGPLNQVRFWCSQRLSDSRASQLRSISQTAWSHVRLDATTLYENTVHYVESLARRLGAFATKLRKDPWFLYHTLEAGILLFLVSALIALGLRAIVTRRNQVRWWFLHKTSSAAIARYLEPFIGFLQCAVVPSSLLFLVWMGRWLLRDIGAALETERLLQLAFWYAGYAITTHSLARAIPALARRHQGVSTQIRLKIVRSVRWLGQLIWGVFFLWTVLGAELHMVMIFIIVKNLIWLAALGVVFRILYQWRNEIVSGYLDALPEGWLGDRLRGSEGRPSRMIYSALALAILGAHGTVALGRDILLEFRQSRRALSYLFQYQQARKGEGTRPAFSMDDLPESVVQAFNGAPTEDPGLLLNRHGTAQEMQQMFSSFPEQGNAVLVHGERGIGKTTCLLQMQRVLADALPESTRFIEVRPTRRILDVPGVFQVLEHAWDRDADEETDKVASCNSLLERFGGEESPPVVMLDGLEWFFLRSVGGLEALDALLHLIHSTRGKVIWLVSVSRQAYRYLIHVRPLDAHFKETIPVKPWSEDEVRGLILRRVARSHVEISVDSFLAKGQENEDTDVHVVGNQDGYIRLLWDFTEGNPRVAQHFWMRSLYKDESGQLKVGLPAHPNASELDALSEGERFLLRAFVEHRALTAEEAARSLNRTQDEVRTWMARGQDHGWYEEVGPMGAAGICVHWWEAAIRFLRRKNLLT